MSNVPRKKPLVYIGLILFVGITLAGVILEFIKKAGGRIVFPALAVGFIFLAIFLGLEELLRRREAKMTDIPDDQFELDGENRFIRHTEPQEDFYAEDDYPAHYDAADDYFDEPEQLPADESFESNQAEQAVQTGGLFSRRRASVDHISSPEYSSEEDDQTSGFFSRRPAAAEYTAEPEYLPEEYDQPEAYAQPEEYAQPEHDEYYEPEQSVDDEEEFLKPVMVLGAPAHDPSHESISEPVDVIQPEEEYSAPEPTPAAPVPSPQPAAPAASAARVPAPQPAAPAAAMGQSLESFYADMSDEDILYRDCVEVWAEDAKPCMLKLLKYVESIEDKQTQAAFGRECEYINAMIDRICFFNKLEYIESEMQPTRCNFSSMVKECLKRFSPFFMEKRLGLLWKGLDIEAVIDRKWFIFALTQVIFNSVEFTPEGGKIAISAKKNGSFVDLSVDDGGCGISADDMPYVLMAGFMSDDAQDKDGKRTGMGLFIARSVAIKMGGDLYVESNNGKGTRVTFHLPTGM